MHADETRAIREDIERTRDRMGHTVEALGERLNPSRLKQQVKDNIREATIGRVQIMANNAKNRVEEGGRGLVATLRENPIPAAMIVGGLGWLLFARKRGDVEVPVTPQPVVSRFEAAYLEDAHGSISAASTGTANEEGRIARVADSASAAGHKVADAASSAGHKVADAASSATHKVADAASSAKGRVATLASSAAHGVADGARATQRKAADTLESNPLALGALAAGIGLAVGLSIPGTEREARLMGEKRDELLDKARERVSETKDKVISAAERIVPEVKDSVVEGVKEMKSSVTDTVREVAREEGLAG